MDLKYKSVTDPDLDLDLDLDFDLDKDLGLTLIVSFLRLQQMSKACKKHINYF